jgi:hypothetical protein
VLVDPLNSSPDHCDRYGTRVQLRQECLSGDCEGHSLSLASKTASFSRIEVVAGNGDIGPLMSLELTTLR